MSYPTEYTRQFDFQSYQNANPTRPLPGDKVNVDLNALVLSISEIIDFIQGITRADGALANGIVTVESLGPVLAAALGDLDSLDVLTGYVDDAAASAAAAAVSETNSAASVVSAAALLDSFDDKYLGAKAANPTLDNDGNALAAGQLYWNTAVSEMRVYTGAAWASFGGGLSDLVSDVSPQLGGDLDLNGHVITGFIDTDADMLADSDTVVPSQKAVSTRISNELSLIPAFSANKNGTNQTAVVTDVSTKVTFTTEEFDTGGLYDATNSKWVPQAGVVRVTVAISTTSAALEDGGLFRASIYKNGAEIKEAFIRLNGTAFQQVICSSLVPVNGSDYIEAYARVANNGGAAGDKTVSGNTILTYFCGEQVSMT